jgi:peptidoglycan/LPS O-acetylase OafA/YrhL
MSEAGRVSARNRYIDLLRAAAIVRVVVYHVFGWAWLTFLLPAMGVMFALGGSLMAASLSSKGARKAIVSRMRRLVPALWVLGLIAVPVMLWHGWSSHDPEHPFEWPKLAFWLLPIGDPPGSVWGEPFWEVLWYIRAYLWFVLASPLLFWLYRRAPWPTIAIPLMALAALVYTGFRLPDAGDAIMWDFVTYCACWIAGFAHHDGRLRRLPVAVHVALVIVLGAAGGYYLFTHPAYDGFDLNEVPIARTMWSLGFVILVLRFNPTMAWLVRVRALAGAVKLINARAVTIYLWHYPLISVAIVLLAPLALEWEGVENQVLLITLTLALTVAAVLLFGWVEDVAGHKRPSLWPTGTKPRPDAAPVDPAPEPEAAAVGASPVVPGAPGDFPSPGVRHTGAPPCRG